MFSIPWWIQYTLCLFRFLLLSRSCPNCVFASSVKKKFLIFYFCDNILTDEHRVPKLSGMLGSVFSYLPTGNYVSNLRFFCFQHLQRCTQSTLVLFSFSQSSQSCSGFQELRSQFYPKIMFLIFDSYVSNTMKAARSVFYSYSDSCNCVPIFYRKIIFFISILMFPASSRIHAVHFTVSQVLAIVPESPGNSGSVFAFLFKNLCF